MNWHDHDVLGTGSSDIFPASRREQDRQDRLIPLINVVFLLLAFFIIAGTVRAADALDIEPPEAATEGQIDPESPTLIMDRDGLVAIGDARLSVDQAIEALVRQIAGDEDAEVHIKADARVRAADILPLLRRLSDAKITSVRLVATRKRAEQ